ncbi:HupE/UreJ family protein [Delftia tsuruhatensis]
MQALMAGLSHPIAGLDHLLAMVALGLWCGLMLKRQWLPPVAFAACMALGLALTQTPLELPAVEPMVAASLLAFGLLLVAQRRLPVALAMVLAGAFALFHGYAHGEVFPTRCPQPCSGPTWRAWSPPRWCCMPWAWPLAGPCAAARLRPGPHAWQVWPPWATVPWRWQAERGSRT